MSRRSSADSGVGCTANLLTLAGVLLVIAGGLAAYPSFRQAVEPTPASFGEAAPPLRPTVTPLPAPGQVPFDALVLPETPLLPSDQDLPTPESIATPSTDKLADDVPSRIVIPAIDLDAPITPVGLHQVDNYLTWDVPNYFAAGWLNNSATLGQPGNTVLDGHHNILGKVFANLKDLKKGDQILVYSGTQEFLYVVVGVHNLLERDQPIEVREQNAKWIQPTTDERLTLVTCWPPNNNTNRLIVVAKPPNGRQSQISQ